MKNKDYFFKNILDENKDRIFRICCYYVFDKEDRKDLYQDVLYKIWNDLEKFRGDAEISTWIYRVTVNSALAFLSRKRGKQKQTAAYKDFLTINSINDDEKFKDINLLHKAISQLPLIDMIIISLVLEEASSKEIAKITGLTESNVRVRIHRAKDTLKDLIERGDQ